MNELKNKCQFIGNLGKDPEAQYTPSGALMLKFSICVNMTTRSDEGYDNEPLWIDLVSFGKRAEGWKKILKKGTKVAVECEYKKRKYQNQDGQNRYSHDFNVRNLELLGGGRGRDEAAEDGDFETETEGGFGGEIPF